MVRCRKKDGWLGKGQWDMIGKGDYKARKGKDAFWRGSWKLKGTCWRKDGWMGKGCRDMNEKGDIRKEMERVVQVRIVEGVMEEKVTAVRVHGRGLEWEKGGIIIGGRFVRYGRKGWLDFGRNSCWL